MSPLRSELQTIHRDLFFLCVCGGGGGAQNKGGSTLWGNQPRYPRLYKRRSASNFFPLPTMQGTNWKRLFILNSIILTRQSNLVFCLYHTASFASPTSTCRRAPIRCRYRSDSGGFRHARNFHRYVPFYRAVI